MDKVPNKLTGSTLDNDHMHAELHKKMGSVAAKAIEKALNQEADEIVTELQSKNPEHRQAHGMAERTREEIMGTFSAYQRLVMKNPNLVEGSAKKVANEFGVTQEEQPAIFILIKKMMFRICTIRLQNEIDK